MKVLIVEDDAISRSFLYELLNPYGECHAVSNGFEALKLFEEAFINEVPFDLICLDLMMIGMDGNEVLKKVRVFEEEHKNEKYIPCKIIITTAIEDPAKVIDTFENKADAYIVKPIELENLQVHLKHLKLVNHI